MDECPRTDKKKRLCQLEVLGRTLEPVQQVATKPRLKKEPVVYGQPYSQAVDGGVVVVLPGVLPPGLNQIKHMDPFEYNRVKKSWMWLIKAATLKNQLSFQRADIAMTVYRIGRMDKDNTEASFKIPGDALRDLHVIRNDDTQSIRTDIKNVLVKPSQRHEIKTEIKIVEWK
jgi:hypothetical protein